MGNFLDTATTIAMGIIGVAIVAVLVSNRSQTSSVIQSMASGFGNTLGVAMTPVTGASAGINLGYPGAAASSMGGGGASLGLGFPAYG